MFQPLKMTEIFRQLLVTRETKTILKGVTGCFKSGELTAIMGPSGAGKSSLLNILTGFQDEGVNGSITTNENSDNGEPMNALNRNGVCRKNSCYIMQDDQLCPLFTVTETMYMAANFKLGSSLSKMCKQILIKDILHKLGLTPASNTKCVRLSGGQKKRLSIALELIDNPPVMFLDEPTTGLDSQSSNMCISILRNLARDGRTIVCTIHQPSATIFEMFDHIYVIAEGLCIYQGSWDNVVPFLQTIGLHCPPYHNPADFFKKRILTEEQKVKNRIHDRQYRLNKKVMEVVTGEYGCFTSQLISATTLNCWKSSPKSLPQSQEKKSNGNINVSDIKKKPTNGHIKPASITLHEPSELYRFFMLMNRCLIKLHRDWTVTHLKTLMHLCVGVLIGLIYSKCGVDGGKTFSNVGFLIVSLVYLSYTSLMPAILKFPSELNVLRKEQFNHWYKLSTFFLAFLITNIPVQMVFCFIYSSVSYYLSSQILIWSRFVMFSVVCQLMTVISEGFGLILGTCVTPVNGVFLGAVLTCFFILFAGYVALFSHMNVLIYYLSYLSYYRYAFEGLVSAVYGGNRAPLECDVKKADALCYYRYPQKIFEVLSMKEERYYSDVAMLGVFFLTFTVVGFFTLRRRIKNPLS